MGGGGNRNAGNAVTRDCSGTKGRRDGAANACRRRGSERASGDRKGRVKHISGDRKTRYRVRAIIRL